MVLKKVLRRPLPIIIFSFIASFLGMAVLLTRPAEFIAPDAVSEIDVTVEFLPGATLEAALSGGIEISRALSGLPEISSFYGRMGAEADDTSRRSDPDYRKEKLLFRCTLAKSENAEAAIEKISYALKNCEESIGHDLSFFSAAPREDRAARVLGLSSALTLAVKAMSPAECSELAENLADGLRQGSLEYGRNILESIRQRPSGTRPQIRLSPRRDFLAAYGISAAEIAASVFTASEGVITGSMEIEGRPIDIRVSGSMNDPLLLGRLPFVSYGREKAGSPVFLSSLAEIEWTEAETAIARQDRSDVIYLDLFPVSGEGGRVNGLLEKISGLPRSSGASVSRADQSVFVRYRTALITTVVLVIVLLYLVLGAQFESFILPLILMLSVPFSLAGAGPALFLSGSTLDSNALLGLVVLFGLSVNNGIILYEISEARIREGLQPAAAVYSGARLRFRSVLLTTLTTIAALLPLVISPLGNSQRSMAVTMLGGTIVSGLLAFFALPPVFIGFLKRQVRHG